MLNWLGKEQGCQLMRGACTLELGLSLSSSPPWLIQFANVRIKGFGEERTCRDSSVWPVWVFRFTMTLVKYHSPDRVQVFQRKQIGVLDDQVEEQPEVPNTLHPSIHEMPCRYRREVNNIWFQAKKNFCGIMIRDSRDLEPRGAYFSNDGVVMGSTLIWGRRVYLWQVRRLEIR